MMFLSNAVVCNSSMATLIPSAIGVLPFSDRVSMAFFKVLASFVSGVAVLISSPKLTTAS